jgi:predicted metal-dependent phosphoesterase TrpH
MTAIGKADLHIHTSYSDGMFHPAELLEHVEERTDLDVIAVTDHDDIRGALRVRDLWARHRWRFEVVTGVELTTIEGHLLALFVDEPLPNLCRVDEAIEAVRKQGGLCVAPHPMNPWTRSLGARDLCRLGRGGALDGLELANCSPGSGLRRRQARSLNSRKIMAAAVGGSDAHFLDFVGSAFTEFPGATAAALRQAVLSRETAARNGPRPSLRRIGPRRLLHQAYRGFMTTPRRMGWWPTARSFVRRIVTVR